MKVNTESYRSDHSQLVLRFDCMQKPTKREYNWKISKREHSIAVHQMAASNKNRIEKNDQFRQLNDAYVL